MKDLLQQLQAVMDGTGYGRLTQDKTLDEVVQEINEQLLDINEIDPAEPYEVAKYELKDMFYNKHWVSIDAFVRDEDLEKLYALLCDWKRNK
jgi:hypothetical protein